MHSAPHEFPVQRYWTFAVLFTIILFSAVVRLRLLELPLERDEGEYAYAGQLILHGVPPYLQAYNMKLPGVYAAYGLIMAIFGETIAGIHIGLILVNGASVVLVFFLASRLFDSLAGLVASSTFAILSLSPSVLGLAAHATHFVVLAALGGLVLLDLGIDNRKPVTLFLSGLLFGLAFLMKQPAIFFVAFGALYLLWAEIKSRPVSWSTPMVRIAFFSLGVIIPFGLTCLILLQAGVFKNFWFWTFAYASQYVSELSFAQAWQQFSESIHRVVGPSKGMWSLAGIGLVCLWFVREMRMKAIFATAFLVFSFLAVCPGFFFRRHYFIVLLPAIAILTGVAVSCVRNLLRSRQFPFTLDLSLPLLAFFAAVGQSLNQDADYFLKLSPEVASRALYGRNPFPESVQIANYIKANSAAGDRIAVIGSEPQIYFYAHRRSATGYIYTYGLMEEQSYAGKMQQEMINEIESAHPKYLVYVNVAASWLRRPQSETRIFEWTARYCQAYELVALADILPWGETVYRWGNDARNYAPTSDCVLYVYKLRTGISDLDRLYKPSHN